MTLTDQQRRARSWPTWGRNGCLEGVMLMHGFGAVVVGALVRDGLAITGKLTSACPRACPT